MNACDRDAFVKALGWIFEGSPWVAERAWARRPFVTPDDLHETMTAEVDGARRDEQLALLRAHPDLGSRGRMSEASSGEQTGAGLTRLSAADFDRLQALNATYHQRFNFPFLLAVGGRTTDEILAALEARSTRPVDEEFAEALGQVYRIAWLRLQEMLR